MNVAHYTKFIVQIVGVVLAAVAAALVDGLLTPDEAVNLALLSLGAIATYLVPNLEAGIGRYLKLIIAALSAGLTLLASSLTDGVTLSEWLMIGAAVLAAFSTYALPNAPELVAIGQHTDGSTTSVYTAAHPADAPDGGEVAAAPDVDPYNPHAAAPAWPDSTDVDSSPRTP